MSDNQKAAMAAELRECRQALCWLLRYGATPQGDKDPIVHALCLKRVRALCALVGGETASPFDDLRRLTEERDALRKALRHLVDSQDCGAPETDPIHPRLWANARAALGGPR